ncbi:hypothetical protein [Rahnella sp. PCH160]|uniref:hypothetical protein n=1 Tax=Rahnella sp. PCH160 TaxID=3447928 RepID=UPI0039FCADC7
MVRFTGILTLTAAEKNQLSPTLTIDQSSNELYINNKKSGTFTCNVACLTISHGAITLSFFEKTIKDHEDNMLFHLEPHENIPAAKFYGGFPPSKTIFDEIYMFEYHSNSNEWFLCICDAEGKLKSEEKFDENGLLRILHIFFYKKIEKTIS